MYTSSSQVATYFRSNTVSPTNQLEANYKFDNHLLPSWPRKFNRQQTNESIKHKFQEMPNKKLKQGISKNLPEQKTSINNSEHTYSFVSTSDVNKLLKTYNNLMKFALQFIFLIPLSLVHVVDRSDPAIVFFKSYYVNNVMLLGIFVMSSALLLLRSVSKSQTLLQLKKINDSVLKKQNDFTINEEKCQGINQELKPIKHKNTNSIGNSDINVMDFIDDSQLKPIIQIEQSQDIQQETASFLDIFTRSKSEIPQKDQLIDNGSDSGKVKLVIEDSQSDLNINMQGFLNYQLSNRSFSHNIYNQQINSSKASSKALKFKNQINYLSPQKHTSRVKLHDSLTQGNFQINKKEVLNDQQNSYFQKFVNQISRLQNYNSQIEITTDIHSPVSHSNHSDYSFTQALPYYQHQKQPQFQSHIKQCQDKKERTSQVKKNTYISLNDFHNIERSLNWYGLCYLMLIYVILIFLRNDFLDGSYVQQLSQYFLIFYITNRLLTWQRLKDVYYFICFCSFQYSNNDNNVAFQQRLIHILVNSLFIFEILTKRKYFNNSKKDVIQKKLIKIQENENQIKSLLHSIPYGIAVLNLSDISHFNQTFAKEFGIKGKKDIEKTLELFQRDARKSNVKDSEKQNNQQSGIDLLRQQDGTFYEQRDYNLKEDLIYIMQNKDSSFWNINNIFETYALQNFNQNGQFKKEIGRKFYSISISPIQWCNKECLLITMKDITMDKIIDQKQVIDRLKNMIFKSFTHELKTPLNGIIMSLETSHFLSDKLISKVEKERNRGMIQLQEPLNQSKQLGTQLKIMESCAFILKNIMHDFFDYHQLQSHELVLNVKEFDLNEFIHDIQRITTYQLQSDDVEFLCKVKYLNRNGSLQRNQNVKMISDKDRLQQILLNLLMNSLKFTQSGLIILDVIVNSDFLVKFKVKDTGIGIEDSRLPYIFNLFEKNEASNLEQLLTAKHQCKKFSFVHQLIIAARMGLPISQNLCQLLGGNIQVKSKVGKGTTFLFNLPLKYQQKDSLFFNKNQSDISVLSAINGLSSLTSREESLQFKFNNMDIFGSQALSLNLAEEIVKEKSQQKNKNQSKKFVFSRSNQIGSFEIVFEQDQKEETKSPEKLCFQGIGQIEEEELPTPKLQQQNDITKNSEEKNKGSIGKMRRAKFIQLCKGQDFNEQDIAEPNNCQQEINNKQNSHNGISADLAINGRAFSFQTFLENRVSEQKEQKSNNLTYHYYQDRMLQSQSISKDSVSLASSRNLDQQEGNELLISEQTMDNLLLDSREQKLELEKNSYASLLMPKKKNTLNQDEDILFIDSARPLCQLYNPHQRQFSVQSANKFEQSNDSLNLNIIKQESHSAKKELTFDSFYKQLARTENDQIAGNKEQRFLEFQIKINDTQDSLPTLMYSSKVINSSSKKVNKNSQNFSFQDYLMTSNQDSSQKKYKKPLISGEQMFFKNDQDSVKQQNNIICEEYENTVENYNREQRLPQIVVSDFKGNEETKDVTQEIYNNDEKPNKGGKRKPTIFTFETYLHNSNNRIIEKSPKQNLANCDLSQQSSQKYVSEFSVQNDPMQIDINGLLLTSPNPIKKSFRNKMHIKVPQTYDANFGSDLDNNFHVENQIQCCPEIMIVDDVQMNRYAVQQMLLLIFDLRIIEAQNGQECIDKLKQFYQQKQCKCDGIQLILMDIEMPVMNGIDATKFLVDMMRDKLIPEIPIVALTAYLDEKKNCHDAGMKDFSKHLFPFYIYIVNKPASKLDLQEVLEKFNVSKNIRLFIDQ